MDPTRPKQIEKVKILFYLFFSHDIIPKKVGLHMKLNLKDPAVWKQIKPWIYITTYVILLSFLLFHIAEIKDFFTFIVSTFRSLIYGIIFAYILNLPMKKIENFLIKHTKETNFLYKHKRMFSMFFTFLFSFLLLFLLGSIIIPNIIASFVTLLSNLSSFFLNLVNNIDSILAYFHIDLKMEDFSHVEQFLNMPWDVVVKNVVALLGGSASNLYSNASTFISTFAVGFTGFMFSLYLLSGKENYLRQLRKTVVACFGYRISLLIFDYASKVNRIFSSFISGQLTEACILWGIYYISMRVLQFPFPELISTLIAICSLVPVFGSMFAMCIGAIMMLSVDPMKALWFIIFFQLLSYIEDNLIYPRVVGNSVGLPGLWVLLCIFVFGDLWGIFGMIIAVPVTACLYTFFSQFVHDRLHQQKLIVTDTTIKKEETTQDE